MMFTAVVFLLAGCQYESPLTKEHHIAVDPAVLGVWKVVQNKEGQPPQQEERMIILKYSDTEYLIHYPPGGNDEIYYRGYPIKIGGLSCVQLQVIGTDDGPPKEDEKNLFFVASYGLKDGRLAIRTLNTEVVDDSLKTTDELRKAFLANRDNRELFKDAGVFRKIKK